MRHVPEELMQAVEDQIDATQHNNPAAIEKERLWNLVSDITLFTMANREVLLKEAAKEQEDLLDRIRRSNGFIRRVTGISGQLDATLRAP